MRLLVIHSQGIFWNYHQAWARSQRAVVHYQRVLSDLKETASRQVRSEVRKLLVAPLWTKLSH